MARRGTKKTTVRKLIWISVFSFVAVFVILSFRTGLGSLPITEPSAVSRKEAVIEVSSGEIRTGNHPDRQPLPIINAASTVAKVVANRNNSNHHQTVTASSSNGRNGTTIPSSPNRSSIEDEIDWTDYIFTRDHYDNDPIVVESHNLMFFTVPKNACTEFKMLFRRMMGFSNWKTMGSKSEILHNPRKNGLKYLGSYPRAKQEEFMRSPDWTRAIFLRDPMERVLSAYLDKGLGAYKEFENVAGGYIKQHSCQMKKNLRSAMSLAMERSRLERKKPQCLALFPFEKDATPETFSFDLFVQKFMQQFPDPHWARQSIRMKDANWKHINFVGHVETLKEDGRALLRRIGAFDEFGKEGWGPNNDTIFEQNIAQHATSARGKTDRYYHANNNNTQTESLVLHYYRNDYNHPVMNLTKPASWERIMGNGMDSNVRI